MFAEKPLITTSNSSPLHLPPVTKSMRRRPIRYASHPNTSISPDLEENVSALKAKYMDYTTWLKTSSRHQRQPIVTEELLKQSLCHMGINSNQAEQLVTTCRWYVYQFQKDLQLDSEQQKETLLSMESPKIERRNKTKNLSAIKSDESNVTKTSQTKGKLRLSEEQLCLVRFV